MQVLFRSSIYVYVSLVYVSVYVYYGYVPLVYVYVYVGSGRGLFFSAPMPLRGKFFCIVKIHCHILLYCEDSFV